MSYWSRRYLVAKRCSSSARTPILGGSRFVLCIPFLPSMGPTPLTLGLIFRVEGFLDLLRRRAGLRDLVRGANEQAVECAHRVRGREDHHGDLAGVHHLAEVLDVAPVETAIQSGEHRSTDTTCESGTHDCRGEEQTDDRSGDDPLAPPMVRVALDRYNRPIQCSLDQGC